jgi:predicted nucleotidyltransferase
MNQEIISKLQIEKKNLFDKYKVTRLGVFGSFARGEETPDSDLDILVEFSEIPGMIEFLKTEEYLETILNRKIDLVRENAIRPELKSVIMSEVIMI